MHASKDLRNLKCLDGLHYSFEMLDYNFSTLYESCYLINSEQKNLIPSLSKCWSIIDTIHRIREISQAIPGLSNKNKELVCFLRETNIAEEFRHYIQHLRSELSKKELDPFPVYGSLSWVDPNDENISHTAIIGTQIDGTSYPSAVYDRYKRKWVSKVTISVNDKSFNFDTVYEATIKFKSYIIPWMRSSYIGDVNVPSRVPIMSAKITLKLQNQK